MKGLRNIENLVFIGIGGIGMSALALWALSHQYKVYGYDKEKTSMTNQLSKLGAQIIFQQSPSQLLDSNKMTPNNTWVIYTSAIKLDSYFIQYFKNKDFNIIKRAALLGYISKENFTIAIAGTHGKTSVVSLLTHLLKSANIDCKSFIGGIPVQYNSPYIAGKEKIMVVEADEFDQSFLSLDPNIIGLTSIDADHLDSYKDYQSYKAGFQSFLSYVKNPSERYVYQDIPLNINAVGYAYEKKDATIATSNAHYKDGLQYFNFKSEHIELKNLSMPLFGIHNIENATLAIAIALMMKVDENTIRNALITYQGVKRRFEYIINKKKQIFIDDYAHHPQALKVVIQTVKTIYPHTPITLVFQPHLFSRTQYLAQEFAQELAKVSHLIVLEIYPAREKPIKGINAQFLLDKIALKNKMLLNKTQLYKYLKEKKPSLLMTTGAGDIANCTSRIKKILTHELS